jgi:hypothetical protein
LYEEEKRRTNALLFRFFSKLLARFLADHPHSHFIALYLGRPDNANARWLGSELLDIVLEGEERQTVDTHINNVVVIDTSPIGTVDFSMGAEEKAFLLQVGKAAALKFLFNRNLDGGPSQQEVDLAQTAAGQARQAVRHRKRLRRLGWVLYFATTSIALWLAAFAFFAFIL